MPLSLSLRGGHGTKPLGVTATQGTRSLARAEHTQTRCTCRQHQGWRFALGPGTSPAPQLSQRGPRRAQWVCWRAEPSPMSPQQMLTHFLRGRQHRDACCMLHARARRPIHLAENPPQNSSSPLSLTMQVQATSQPEDRHSRGRKPLRQGHPCHPSALQGPATPHGTTGRATCTFAFEEAHDRGNKTLQATGLV